MLKTQLWYFLIIFYFCDIYMLYICDIIEIGLLKSLPRTAFSHKEILTNKKPNKKPNKKHRNINKEYMHLSNISLAQCSHNRTKL